MDSMGDLQSKWDSMVSEGLSLIDYALVGKEFTDSQRSVWIMSIRFAMGAITPLEPDSQNHLRNTLDSVIAQMKDSMK